MNKLKQFFEERPSLNKEGFCREAGITNTLLNYILKGNRRLTDRTHKKLLPVMIKYGYDEKE